MEVIFWKYEIAPSFSHCVKQRRRHMEESILSEFSLFQRRFIWLKYREGEGKELFSNL